VTKFRAPRFKECFVRRLQIWILLQDALLFYCVLYTDCSDGRIDAVARHMSFAEITCVVFCDCSKDNREEWSEHPGHRGQVRSGESEDRRQP